MLRYIEISNIALIDRASIDFDPGLCVLTGETGAGKSIVIDSINAVLGARVTRDIVRKGAGGAAVTAVFSFGAEFAGGPLKEILRTYGLADESQPADCNEQPEDEDGGDMDADGVANGGGDVRQAGGTRPQADGTRQTGGTQQEQEIELILSREIGASGRSVCRVNGKIVASPALREIGELIVDLHGQHENHSLMKREKHIEMIDNFGGPPLLALRERYSALYAKYSRIKRQISDLAKSEAERAREIDMLKFQINEIKAVRPRPGEDERLLREIEELANAEKIDGALDAALAALNGDGSEAGGQASALAGVSGASRQLAQIAKYSDEYAGLSARLSDARYAIEDIIAAIRLRRDAGARDPGRLDKLSGRHEAIERLKRKYGATVSEVHKFYRQATDKLNELTNSEQTAAELERELHDVAAETGLRAGELTAMRQNAARAIEEGVVSELEGLEMKNCRFEVQIGSAQNIDGYNPRGRDQLEFLFCANPGEELKPLIRIASGGEMSRVMLAIKSVLTGADGIPTMIFDEIDAGISGKAAARVAEKMRLLSGGRQIICVTHLAQIACMADAQFMIEKTSTDAETQTRIHKLDYADRADEISRMLGGGAPTEASLRLSRELLERAESFKVTTRK